MHRKAREVASLALVGLGCIGWVMGLNVSLPPDYENEMEEPNIFGPLAPVVSKLSVNAWDDGHLCHFPNAGVRIELRNVSGGIWLPYAMLQHTDEYLHPFVNPYGDLQCMVAKVRYDGTVNRLILQYGCAEGDRWDWRYRFDFTANKRIRYTRYYGCPKRKLLRRVVIAKTDYERYLILHGCQYGKHLKIRGNGVMIFVRDYNVSDELLVEMLNYTRQVLMEDTILQYRDDNDKDFTGCNCSKALDHVFCDPGYRFRRRDEVLRKVYDKSYLYFLALVGVVGLLPVTYTFLSYLLTVWPSNCQCFVGKSGK